MRFEAFPMPVLAPLHLAIQTCVGLCNGYIRCPKRKTDCGVTILCVIEDGFADFFLAMTFAPVGVLQQPVAALRQAQGPVKSWELGVGSYELELITDNRVSPCERKSPV